MVKSESKELFKPYTLKVILRSTITLVLLVFSGLSVYFCTKTTTLGAQVSGEFIHITREITPSPTITRVQPIYALPVRLIIPEIGVNANIVPLGLKADGSIDVPGNLNDVGWYKYNPRPGEMGSAVIDGHHGVGTNAVFMNLNKLQIGDIFKVIDANGQTINFIVKRTKDYDPSAHPAEVYLNDDGYHLNLITCDGTWNSAKQTMSQRRVVFADKI
jgi:LPXTG-site transpeptidase (sortase) family protein